MASPGVVGLFKVLRSNAARMCLHGLFQTGAHLHQLLLLKKSLATSGWVRFKMMFSVVDVVLTSGPCSKWRAKVEKESAVPFIA